MAKYYEPGSTLGLVGSSVSNSLLARACDKLGYQVGSLVKDSDSSLAQFTTWQDIVPVYKSSDISAFADKVDVLYLRPGALLSDNYKHLRQKADVILPETLVNIFSDPIEERIYLDKAGFMLPPYLIVEDVEDIKNAKDDIGFPCYLKVPNRRRMQLLFIGEEDTNALEQAERLLDGKKGSLEAYIPIDKKVYLPITVSSDEQLLVYPLIEEGNISPGKKYLSYPADVSDEIATEISRQGQNIIRDLGFTGTLFIEFWVSTYGLIYLNRCHFMHEELLLFSEGLFSTSFAEATVRAWFGLPFPAVRTLTNSAVGVSFKHLDQEKLYEQHSLRADWKFIFLPIKRVNQKDSITGQVIVTGESPKACLRQLNLLSILK